MKDLKRKIFIEGGSEVGKTKLIENLWKKISKRGEK